MKCQHEPSSNIHHNQVKVSHEGESDSLFSSTISLFLLCPSLHGRLHSWSHQNQTAHISTDSLSSISLSSSYLLFSLKFSLTGGGSSEWAERELNPNYITFPSFGGRKKRKGSLSLSNLISNSVSFLTHHLSLILSSLFSLSHLQFLPLPLIHHLSSNDIRSLSI